MPSDAADPRRPPLERIRPEIRQMPGYRLKAYDCSVKLNQNESPFDVPDEIKDRILESVRRTAWSRYPEPMPSPLVAALADYAGVSPDSLIVSNGSNTLASVFLSVSSGPGVRVVMPTPSFSLYEQYTVIHGGEPVAVPLGADMEYDVGRLIDASRNAGVVLVCSPNNPTGTSLADDAMEALLASTDALVLVDEAYGEFSGTDSTRLLGTYPNLVIMRTLSKAFGAAGVRIGYLIAHPAITAEIVKAKLPFNIGFFPCTAALEILRHRDLIRERIATIVSERDRVYRALEAMEGVTPIRSQANFICMSVSDPKDIFNRLVEQDILVRDVSGYPHLETSLRVSIGTAEENGRFLEALGRAMKESGKG